MISFTEWGDLPLDKLSAGERSEAEEYLGMSAVSEDGTEAEIRYSISHGCLLFRLFDPDMGYYFWPAVPLSDEADVRAAYASVSDYCVLEAIREVYVDLAPEDVELVTEGKTHPSVTDISGGDGEAFAVEIENECTLLSELPEIMHGDIYLGELAMAYAESYARLVTDEKTNRYFGYSLLSDVPSGRGEDLIEFVRSEFDRRESVTLAATLLSDEGENVFIGEGTLFAFRGDSTASVSFRLLPEWQGKGYGKKLYAALVALAGRIGLVALRGEVMRENVRSAALMRSAAALISEGDVLVFRHDIC